MPDWAAITLIVLLAPTLGMTLWLLLVLLGRVDAVGGQLRRLRVRGVPEPRQDAWVRLGAMDADQIDQLRVEDDNGEPIHLPGLILTMDVDGHGRLLGPFRVTVDEPGIDATIEPATVVKERTEL